MVPKIVDNEHRMPEWLSIANLITDKRIQNAVIAYAAVVKASLDGGGVWDKNGMQAIYKSASYIAWKTLELDGEKKTEYPDEKEEKQI